MTVHFGLVELDLLAAHAGVPLPFPLRVPSFGRITGEREVLLAAAGHTLRTRGLADGHGPVGLAAELVTALREHRGTVDLVLAGPDGSVGVVAMVYRSWALLCRQPLNDDLAGTVRIQRVAQTALAGELIGMVPAVAPAVSMPITLAPGEIDPEVLDQLAGLLPTLLGRGQLGATRRAELSGSTRAGTELSWLDSPRGRVRVDRAADGWLSVNPLRQTDLRHALDELAGLARREGHGSNAVAHAV